MSTMSPELALVDPELRAEAVARLPPIYVNAFLDFPEVSALPVAQPAVRTTGFRPGAALAYLALSITRTALFDLVVFASVFAVVLLASAIS
jgi:hypothetical protein